MKVKISRIIFVFSVFFAPIVTFAAQTFTQTNTALTNLNTIIGAIIPIVFALGVVGFIWGGAKFIIQADNPKARVQGRAFMIWGVIAVAVMASVWGLVAFLGTTLGINITGITGGDNTGTSGSSVISGGEGDTGGGTSGGGVGLPEGPTTQAPDAPVISSSTAGPNSITFTWSDADDGGAAITQYTVQYRPTGTSSWTTLGNVTATGLNVTGLAAGTSYDFRVSATNEIGAGDYSQPGTFTTTSS